jgi:hypothetical protein
MAWSTTPIADGDSVAISGDVLQKGSMQLGWFLAPLDDYWRPDVPLDEALLLD